jgi:hypothetical protein
MKYLVNALRFILLIVSAGGFFLWDFSPASGHLIPEETSNFFLSVGFTSLSLFIASLFIKLKREKP